MIWLFLLVAIGMAAFSLLMLWRLREDAEYERTLRRHRWWDY